MSLSKHVFIACWTGTYVGDNEAASGSLVLGLPRHDSAVDVVRVGARREDEEERSHADEDVERRGHRALHTLGVKTRGAVGEGGERGGCNRCRAAT